MRKIIVIAFIFLSMNIFSMELYKDIETVKVFANGSNEENLKVIEYIFSPYYLSPGPSSVTFDNSGNLYILDPHNERLLKYDYNFSPILSLDYPVEPIFYSPNYLRVIGNYILWIHVRLACGVISFDNNNHKYMMFSNTKYESNLDTYNYYYDEKRNLYFQYLKDGIILFPNPGFDYKKNTVVEGRDNINSYLEENSIDDIIINEDTKVIVNGEIKSNLLSDKHPFNVGNQYVLLGFDINNNSYWDYLGEKVVVISEEHKKLESVPYSTGRNNRTYFPAVHPSGDIYWLEYDMEKVELKRIQNVWDSEGRDSWYKNYPDTN